MKRLAVVCLLISALASCGSDDKAVVPTDDSPQESVETSTPATDPTNAKPEIGPAGEILVRQTVAEFVIATVRANGEEGLNPAVVAEAIVAYYPSISVNGYAIEADQSGISIISELPDSKNLPSAENPHVFGTAVADASGSCVGLVAYGYPTPDQTFTLEDPAVCTADEVFNQFIAQL